MTSRRIRFAVVALALVVGNVVAVRPQDGSFASAAFGSAVSLVLVGAAYRGGRRSLAFLTGTTTLFAALMLTFGSTDPRILANGAAFAVAAYLLWGLRRTPKPVTA